MDKQSRLNNLNQVIDISKRCGCPVDDVWFGWGFDMLVIMRHPMPAAVRDRVAQYPALECVLSDYDPHYGGWTSYNENVIDRENKIAIVFPRPPALLEAHLAELRARSSKLTP